MAATYKQTKPYSISLSLNAFQLHTLLSLGSKLRIFFFNRLVLCFPQCIQLLFYSSGHILDHYYFWISSSVFLICKMG